MLGEGTIRCILSDWRDLDSLDTHAARNVEELELIECRTDIVCLIKLG